MELTLMIRINQDRSVAPLDDGHMKGRVSQQTGQSYRIEFENGNSCMVPKEGVQLVPYHRKQPHNGHVYIQ